MASIRTTGKFLRRPAIFGVLQGIVLFACLVGVREAGLLQPFELEAYDQFLRLHEGGSAVEPRVALLAITEADIQQLGRWPLSDEALAGMIVALQAYQPDVIGVDIYRDLPVPPGTEQLDAILALNSNVFAVEKVGNNGGTGVPPPGVLTGTGRVGFSDLLVDPDGVVRRGLLFLDDGVEVFYSLSLRLALHYLQSRNIQPQAGEPEPSHLRLGDITLPPFEGNDGGYVDADAGGYQFMMDYRGGPQPFATYSLGALLAGVIPRDALQGKVVIIGVAADSVKDDFITPYRHGGHGVPGVPGNTIHAHVTSQLLRAALDGDRPMGVLSDVQEYVWILFWTAAGVALVLLFKAVGKFVPAAIIGTLALLLLAYLAFINGLWLPLVPAGIGWVAAAALMAAYLTSYENAQRRQVMELFSRQVSEDVAREIWKQRDHFMAGGRLAAREVTCTVLFSDLQDFTPVAEKLGATRLMAWLNRYMDIMAGLVLEYGGLVDDYFGDAIMADFGVPLVRTTEAEYRQDARNAVDCALAMRAAIAQLNIQNVKQDLPPVCMRVGINTGEMVVGFLGTSQRMKYTTIGDTVNTAARLESYGKELPPMEPVEGSCRILVGESTACLLGDAYRTESVGALELKGKSRAVNVYKVLSKEV
jgi:adenylate cyclase